MVEMVCWQRVIEKRIRVQGVVLRKCEIVEISSLNLTTQMDDQIFFRKV